MSASERVAWLFWSRQMAVGFHMERSFLDGENSLLLREERRAT